MNAQPELFEPVPPIPRDTRAKAHAKAKISIRQIQQLLLRDLYQGRQFGADEWAGWREINEYMVRPRITGFKNATMIYRVGYAFTNQGNYQDKVAIYPYLQTRMQTMTEHADLDAVINEILDSLKPEKVKKKR